MTSFTIMAPAIGAAFLASLVEVVEAFTIVLATGVMRGWRAAMAGTAGALAVLTLIVLALGPVLERIPIHILQLVIGASLLWFGASWLRKAVLRASGRMPHRDEVKAFETQTAALPRDGAWPRQRFDWLGATIAFKGVLLEGIEVAFIVLAVGAGGGLIVPAAIGALAACVVVLAAGAALHRPLARVPENTLKFAVGVILCAFGIFWIGEGGGIAWPGGDLLIVAFAMLVLLIALGLIAMLRRLRA